MEGTKNAHLVVDGSKEPLSGMRCPTVNIVALLSYESLFNLLLPELLFLVWKVPLDSQLMT